MKEPRSNYVKDGILEAKVTINNRNFVVKEMLLIGLITLGIVFYLNSIGKIMVRPSIIFPIYIMLFIVVTIFPKVYKLYYFLVSLIWGLVTGVFALIVGNALPFYINIFFTLVMIVVGFRVSLNIHRRI